MPRPTLYDIAHAAGVSIMTVSRALRNETVVAEKTRVRIREIAEEFGYRPDPQVTKLMMHLRSSRSPRLTENIGLIWLDAKRAEVNENYGLQAMLKSLHRRAESLGYGVEEFWLSDKGMTLRRLSDILKARSIEGIIFSPILHHSSFELSFPWSEFSMVILGGGHISPPLHRVQTDHFQGVSLAISELAQRGYRQIGLCVFSDTTIRQDHRWEASFLLHHPLGIRAANDLMLIGSEHRQASFLDWVEQQKPDVILSQGVVNQVWLDAAVALMGRPIAIATLDWRPDYLKLGLAGINQHYESWGANAVEIVTSHIHRNDRGLPQSPKLILSEGTWQDGTSMPTLNGE